MKTKTTQDENVVILEESKSLDEIIPENDVHYSKEIANIINMLIMKIPREEKQHQGEMFRLVYVCCAI